MCHTCKKLEGKDDLGTEKLRAEHALKCKMNYSGSAPAMEPECAKRTFSQEKQEERSSEARKKAGDQNKEKEEKTYAADLF